MFAHMEGVAGAAQYGLFERRPASVGFPIGGHIVESQPAGGKILAIKHHDLMATEPRIMWVIEQSHEARRHHPGWH